MKMKIKMKMKMKIKMKRKRENRWLSQRVQDDQEDRKTLCEKRKRKRRTKKGQRCGIPVSRENQEFE